MSGGTRGVLGSGQMIPDSDIGDECKINNNIINKIKPLILLRKVKKIIIVASRCEWEPDTVSCHGITPVLVLFAKPPNYQTLSNNLDVTYKNA